MKSRIIRNILFYSIVIVGCNTQMKISESFYLGMTSEEYYKNTEKCFSLSEFAPSDPSERCIDIPNIGEGKADAKFMNGKLVSLKLTSIRTVESSQIEGFLTYLKNRFGKPDIESRETKDNNVYIKVLWVLDSGLTINFDASDGWYMHIKYEANADGLQNIVPKDQKSTPSI